MEDNISRAILGLVGVAFILGLSTCGIQASDNRAKVETTCIQQGMQIIHTNCVR